MNKLVQELREARPTLKQVSPLSFAVLLVMAIFNLLLGLSLLFAVDQNQSRLSAPLLIVNDLMPYEFWCAVFIGIGILKLYALKVNDWKLARRTLIIGVSVKGMWAVALIFRVFLSPGSIFLTLTWLCIAALQMACYIFFMPPSSANYLQRKVDRDEQ